MAELLGAPALAERFSLPAQTRVAGQVVELDLTNTDLVVVIDPATVEPILSADATRDVGTAEVDVVRGAEGLRIVPVGADLRIQLELRMRADQRLVLRGRQIALRIRRIPTDPELEEESLGTTEAAAGEAGEAGTKAAQKVQLALIASEADLDGLDSVAIEGTNSVVWARDGSGPLELRLIGGRAEIRGQQGPLTAWIRDAAVEVFDHLGDLDVELEGGALKVDAGAGSLDAKSRGADVAIAAWSGAMKFHGVEGRFETRGSGRQNDPWTVYGNDLVVLSEDVAGELKVKLEGGTFDLGRLDGSLQLEGLDGLETTAESISGPVKLRLLDGASARFVDLDQRLTAEVEDSSLSVDGVRRLGLKAVRSQIGVSGVQHLQQVEAQDSSLTMELSEVGRNPRLDLLGSSDATVWLKTPCVVTVDTDDPDRAGQVRVTSCDLRMPGQPLRAAKNRLIHGHRVPVILTLALDEDATAVAEGRTVD